MNKISKYTDFISGVLLLVFSGVLFLGSRIIQMRRSSTGIGPRTMPQIVALILALIAIIILFEAFRKIRKQEKIIRNSSVTSM